MGYGDFPYISFKISLGLSFLMYLKGNLLMHSRKNTFIISNDHLKVLYKYISYSIHLYSLLQGIVVEWLRQIQSNQIHYRKLWHEASNIQTWRENI